MQIKAYAALKLGDELAEYEYALNALQPQEVLIKVRYCGLSQSDVHMIDNDWFCSIYPLVPGHEIVGDVEAIGDEVSSLAVGDRVGLGWHNNYCHRCEFCLTDEQHLCAEAGRTIIGSHGGFASHVLSHEAAVVHIPNQLNSEIAAPLMSAGIAVFNPLLEFKLNKQAKVAIVGAGGLGHLAIQFYKAWGCEVTVFTHDLEKQSSLLALGANQVLNSYDEMAVLQQQNYFDFILVTANRSLDWANYFACLKSKGRLHFVGLPLEPIEIGVFPLVSKQRCISGSQSGSPIAIEKMLNFAVEHNILPHVVTFHYSQISDAIQQQRAGTLKYRAVVDFTDCQAVSITDEVV